MQQELNIARNKGIFTPPISLSPLRLRQKITKSISVLCLCVKFKLGAENLCPRWNSKP